MKGEGAGVEEVSLILVYTSTLFYTSASEVVYPGAGSGQTRYILAGLTTGLELRLYPPRNGDRFYESIGIERLHLWI